MVKNNFEIDVKVKVSKMVQHRHKSLKIYIPQKNM